MGVVRLGTPGVSLPFDGPKTTSRRMSDRIQHAACFSKSVNVIYRASANVDISFDGLWICANAVGLSVARRTNCVSLFIGTTNTDGDLHGFAVFGFERGMVVSLGVCILPRLFVFVFV
jgi:hypothetical protein